MRTRILALATCLGLASSFSTAALPGAAGADVAAGFGTGGRWDLATVDSLAVVAKPDGGVRGVGVRSDRMAFAVADLSATGTGASTAIAVPPLTGDVTIDEIFAVKGVATAADGGTVAQFTTSVGAAVAKVRPDGTLDPAFAGGGYLTDWFVVCGLAADLAVSPTDGRIFTVSHDLGGGPKPECTGSGVRAYSSTGQKLTWGAPQVEGGRQDDRIFGSAITVGRVGGTERVVVSGSAPGDKAGVLVLDTAGSPATGFGTAGLVTFDPVPGMAGEGLGATGLPLIAGTKTAYDVAIDTQGRIVVAGTARRQVGGDLDVWVARLLPSGAFDPSFGTAGFAWPQLGAGQDQTALSLVLDGDRPVVVGTAGPVGSSPDTRGQLSVRLTAAGAVETASLTTSALGQGAPLVPQSAALAGSRVYVGGGRIVQPAYSTFNGYIGAATLPAGAPATPTTNPLFTGVTPVRALDTATDGGPLVAGSSRSVRVTGIGEVPAAGVTAVAVNVTVEAPSAGGFLTAWPSGTAMPLASSLNVAPGQTVANSLVVGVGADGSIDLGLGAGQARAVVDLTGWFADGAGLTAVTPVRAIDTRAGAGTTLAPGTELKVPVTGLVGVPASGVGAVALNLTAVDATAGGHLRAWPSGTATPWASALNFAPGQTIANAMVLGVGPDGTVSIQNFSDGPLHVVVDVAGWFASGSGVHPIAPTRLLDTRSSGPGETATPFGPAEQRRLPVAGTAGVPAAGVRAVVLNVTVTEASAATYVTAWPAGGPLPLASSVNAGPGETVANAIVVGIDPDGAVDLFAAVGTAHVVVDVLGWF